MFLSLIEAGMSGMLDALLLPLLILQLFALVFIPSLLGSGARPFAVGKAVYSYLLQTIGIVAMSLGGIPALFAVLEKLTTGYERYATQDYIALLIVFTAGGLTFLWHERTAQTIDEPSRRVPAALFWFTFKLLGYLLMLLSALSFFQTMLLAPQSENGAWWIMPLLLFLYGVLLSWCTRLPATVAQNFTTLRTVGMPASEVKLEKKAAKGKKK